jgi:plasmid maintenance system antidote protein VapI
MLGLSDGFWVGLQADYDAAKTRRTLGAALERILRFTQPVDSERRAGA